MEISLFAKKCLFFLKSWSRHVSALDHLCERHTYTYKVTCRQRLKVGGISSYKYVGSHPPPLHSPNTQKPLQPADPRLATQKRCVQREERKPEHVTETAAKCHGWEDLAVARCGVKVTQHSEYSMQMIVTAETGMTMMGGGDRWCCEKICLNQPSLFLNLQIIHWYSHWILHTNTVHGRWSLVCCPSGNAAIWVSIICTFTQNNWFITFDKKRGSFFLFFPLLTLRGWLPRLEKNTETFRLKGFQEFWHHCILLTNITISSCEGSMSQWHTLTAFLLLYRILTQCFG